MIFPQPLLTRLCGRPLAIAPRRLEALLSTVASPEAAGARIGSTQVAPLSPAVAADGIAVVPVVGPLVSRGDWLMALLGAVSYADVGDAVEAALADPAIRAVLLELDSPGGEVGGLFDLIERLAALRAAAGKPVWAVASESALSAAYAIASVADRVYVTQTGEVGSVGVVAVHIDESGADAMAGLRWTLIHAGARKVDGNPHEPLSARAFADIQADVDALHARLVEMVAANRGMPPEAVRATEAAIYRGARGVEVGFVDRVGGLAQAIADLKASLDSPRRGTAPLPRVPSPSQLARSEPMTTETPVGAAPAEPPGPTEPAPPAAAPAPQEVAPTTVQAAGQPSPAEELRAQYAEIAAIAAQAARLGVTVDAAEAMRLGLMPDALRRSVLDTLASQAEATAVVSAATTPTTAESPIVRRARQRAAAGKAAAI